MRRKDQITQVSAGNSGKSIDAKLDDALYGQASFIEQTLTSNANGQNVVKGKSADNLEHLIKSLVPVIPINSTKFLFGSSIKTVQVHSEKLQVMVGGGAIPLDSHWRTIAVSETIKLNKLVSQTKKKVSVVVKALLEQAGAQESTINDFMREAKALDSLFTEQKFLLTAWSKKQVQE